MCSKGSSAAQQAWGGRDLDVALTSASLKWEPKQAASLSTPYFGNRLPASQLALKATGLQGQDETGCQEAQEQNKAALLHKRQPETLKPCEDTPRMVCSGGLLSHLKDIPFSLIKKNQKEGLWLCSAFGFGWGLGKRKHCFDEGKGAENLDPKALFILLLHYTQVHHMRSPSKPPFMWHPVVPLLKQLKML